MTHYLAVWRVFDGVHVARYEDGPSLQERLIIGFLKTGKDKDRAARSALFQLLSANKLTPRIRDALIDMFTGVPQRLKIEKERTPYRDLIKEYIIVREILLGIEHFKGSLDDLRTYKNLTSDVARKYRVSEATVKRIWKRHSAVKALDKAELSRRLATQWETVQEFARTPDAAHVELRCKNAP